MQSPVLPSWSWLPCAELQETSQILELFRTQAELEGELLRSSLAAAKAAIPTKGK